MDNVTSNMGHDAKGFLQMKLLHKVHLVLVEVIMCQNSRICSGVASCKTEIKSNVHFLFTYPSFS